MSYDYNALYETTPDALGAPTQCFVDFFNGLDNTPLKVLDIGCGQGRDALFIARLGHSVLGVDMAPSVIRDMTRAAEKDGLAVRGIVADITEFNTDERFDIILIDRTLHMLPASAHLAVLERLAGCIAPNGWMLIADERSNIGAMKRLFAEHPVDWTIIRDTGGTLFLRSSTPIR